jgi:hypothetical protein
LPEAAANRRTPVIRPADDCADATITTTWAVTGASA